MKKQPPSKKKKEKILMLSSFIGRGQRRAFLELSRSLRNASSSSSFSFASSSTRRERRQLFKEEQKPEQHDDTFFPPEKNERRTAYIETYGCQMNAADSEVIAAVLTSHGYEIIESKEKMISMTSPPEVILVNTCAIRDKAEERVKIIFSCPL